MNTILPLFDTAPRARSGDPRTSQAAADIDPARLGKGQLAVLKALYENRDGLTDHELAALVGRPQTSAGKRRGELLDGGLVRDTGTTRLSPYAKACVVWQLTDDGVKAARECV